jgi:hypothetical protein
MHALFHIRTDNSDMEKACIVLFIKRIDIMLSEYVIIYNLTMTEINKR